MNNNLKEIKTTIIGSILFLIGIGVFLYEYFSLNILEWNHYAVPAAFIVGGIGFLLAPDKILNLMLRKASKKLDE